MNIAEMVVVEIVKHLPGKHNQKDHGRGGQDAVESYSKGQNLEHGKVYEMDQKNPMYRADKVRVSLMKNSKTGKTELMQSHRINGEWGQWDAVRKRKKSGEPGKALSFSNPKNSAKAASDLFGKYSYDKMPETKISDGRQD